MIYYTTTQDRFYFAWCFTVKDKVAHIQKEGWSMPHKCFWFDVSKCVKTMFFDVFGRKPVVHGRGLSWQFRMVCLAVESYVDEHKVLPTDSKVMFDHYLKVREDVVSDINRFLPQYELKACQVPHREQVNKFIQSLVVRTNAKGG